MRLSFNALETRIRQKRVDADVVISDTEGNLIEESSIKKFPKNRTLLVSVCYDGQIIIRQDSQTKEIIPIKMGNRKNLCRFRQ